MSPLFMAVLLAGLVGAFSISASRRFRLLATGENRGRAASIDPEVAAGRGLDLRPLSEKDALLPAGGSGAPADLPRLRGAPAAHARSCGAAASSPSFNLCVLGPEPRRRHRARQRSYNFLKDVFALLVLLRRGACSCTSAPCAAKSA